jgi:hypothetical protein
MVKDITSHPDGLQRTDQPPRPSSQMYDLVLGRFKPLEASNTEHPDNSSSSDVLRDTSNVLRDTSNVLRDTSNVLRDTSNVLRDTSYQQQTAGPSKAEGGYVFGGTELSWSNLVCAADQQYQREFGSPGNVLDSEASDNRAYPKKVTDLKAYLAKRKSIEIPDRIYNPTIDEYEKIRSIPRVLEVAIDLNQNPDVVIDLNMVQKSAEFMKDQDAYVSDNELPSGGSIRKPKLPGTRTEQKSANKKEARENGTHVRNYIEATYGYKVPIIEYIAQADGTTKQKRLETPKQILEFAQKMNREGGSYSDIQNHNPESVTSLANRK